MADTTQQGESWDSIINSYNDVAAGYAGMDQEVSTKDQYGNELVPGNYYEGAGYYWGEDPVNYSTPQQTTQQSSGGGSSSGGQTSSGGGSSSGGSTYTGPTYEQPTLEGPGDLTLPEYTPPEYDKAEERKLREEYLAPGMQQIRRSTQQAIVSSKSLDNPNARALFINQALEGVGSAVSDVTASATQSAYNAAQQNYANELSKYFTGWQAEVSAAQTQYQADWSAALAEYNTLSQAWLAHPAGEGEGTNGTQYVRSGYSLYAA